MKRKLGTKQQQTDRQSELEKKDKNRQVTEGTRRGSSRLLTETSENSDLHFSPLNAFFLDLFFKASVMTVWILMLLAAGDAVVISKIFCPRRYEGCCYRQGLNLLAFIIHFRLQWESSRGLSESLSLRRHCCCHQTCALLLTGQSESPWKLDVSRVHRQWHWGVQLSLSGGL